MKKIHYFTTCLLFLTTACVFGSEILKNAGMEEWNEQGFPTAWKVKKNDFVTVKAETERPAEGKAALCLTIAPGGKSVVLQQEVRRFNPKSEEFYRLSWKMRGRDILPLQGRKAPQITAVCLLQNLSMPLEKEFDWKEFSMVFHVERGTAVFHFDMAFSGTVCLDDFRLEKVDESALVEQAKRNRKSIHEPTVWHEKYGPEYMQSYNFYAAKSGKPAPLLIYIHGGGWCVGSGFLMSESGIEGIDKLVGAMLDNGISVAFINYRLGKNKRALLDAARAVQYFRYHAKRLHIDPARFAAMGGSAGGASSLWLALHDDLADPKAEDPVLRESSRLCGAVGSAAQTSVDPETLQKWGLSEAIRHPMITYTAGISYASAMKLDAAYQKARPEILECSAITHLTKDDPTVYLQAGSLNATSDWIHHALFAEHFRQAALGKGIPVEMRLGGKTPDGFTPSRYKNATEYLLDVLKGTPKL